MVNFHEADLQRFHTRQSLSGGVKLRRINQDRICISELLHRIAVSLMAILILLTAATSAVAEQSRLATVLKKHAITIESSADLSPMLEKIGSARLVLLGESTHGTAEYYTWRSEISKRLISEKGFNFIAVEGDWPSCYEINRYIKDLPGAASSNVEALKAFKRWPQWMWANRETAELVEWLRRHNSNLPQEKRIGFYGFDVYSLPESVSLLLEYAQTLKAPLKTQIEAGLAGISRFSDDPISYARHAARSPGYASEVEAVLNLLLNNSAELSAAGCKAYFKALQNAFVVRNAERHYRAMVNPEENSWNKRVDHMKATINRLLDRHGPDAKAVIWAHNTHIGDARATDMARTGTKNIGWLTRDKYGMEQVYSVGFATYQGEVLAGREWGNPVEKMTMPAAISGSIEHTLHQLSASMALILLDEKEVATHLADPIPHRAVGVVYNPSNELGNYVWSVLPRRYNAMFYIDQTKALQAIDFAAP